MIMIILLYCYEASWNAFLYLHKRDVISVQKVFMVLSGNPT